MYRVSFDVTPEELRTFTELLTGQVRNLKIIDTALIAAVAGEAKKKRRPAHNRNFKWGENKTDKFIQAIAEQMLAGKQYHRKDSLFTRLAKEVGLAQSSISPTLTRALDKKVIVRADYGHYTLPKQE